MEGCWSIISGGIKTNVLGGWVTNQRICNERSLSNLVAYIRCDSLIFVYLGSIVNYTIVVICI